MGLFQRLISAMSPPVSGKFFVLMKELAVQIHEGATILNRAVEEGRLGTPVFTRELHELERRADMITDRLMLSIRHTMIHPVDPDDLRDITNGLDDVMDTMDHFSWRMEAYRLKPSGPMGELVRIIYDQSQEIPKLFELLLSGQSDQIDGVFARMTELEQKGDAIFHRAASELHATGDRSYTVEDEILSILELCVDQCELVGQRVVVMLERNR